MDFINLRGRNILFRFMASLSFMGLLITACNVIPTAQPPSITPSATEQIDSTSPVQVAKTTFNLELISPIQSGQSIYLNVLDEVTGLAINPTRYQMKKSDGQHFSLTLPVRLGSVIFYRFTREGGNSVIEYNAEKQQVRYRIFHSEGPGDITDIISGWTDTPYSGPTGRITGTILSSTDNSPLADILVTAGGAQTLSSSDGSFVLEGLPVGALNLVAYSLDGSYNIFQQGAVVAAESDTPTTITLVPAQKVNITFIVNTPQENVIGAPIRMAGNIYALGNTFADLDGGLSTVASRMPLLTLKPDGKYSMVLNLPVGLDLRYKYTLGDGLWNSEQTSDGQFNVRQLIVPNQDTTIEDTITTWRSGKTAPITFDVTVPTNTPPADTISLQINPYGWTEPLPMWSLGNGHWLYVLYSPLDLLTNATYRYCRNDQCGIADDVQTAGSETQGRLLQFTGQGQNIQDQVSAWAMWNPSDQPTAVAAAEINKMGPDFIAGVELSANYNPTWQIYYPNALQKIQKVGNNWVVITPTWTYSQVNPPILQLTPGSNPLKADLNTTLSQINGINLKSAVFPSQQFPDTASLWWSQGTKDFSWWQVWFEQYSSYILYYADLAAQNNAGALILGGESITPALPFGTLADGTASNVPADAELRWQNIIKEVRSHYSGKLYWAVPLSQLDKLPTAIINSVDSLYVLWDKSLSKDTPPDLTDIENQIGQILDTELYPTQQQTSKPIVLGVDFPSTPTSANDCILVTGADCVSPLSIQWGNTPLTAIPVDLDLQVELYNSFLNTVNQRDWISGIVSRGFYPPATLQDGTSSVNGKPANDVLWYWYSQITQAPQ